MASSNAQHNGSGLTLRAVLIAVFLSLFLNASSSYIAIKLGVVPWPIIFSVIVSGGLIKLLSGRRRLNIHEVNIAQAGGSIGGLVAAGLIFTIPGIIYLNKSQGLQIPWPNPFMLALLSVLAGTLGVLLSVPLKATFVDREQLPYPSGMAGAELLKLGKTGGRLLFVVTFLGALAAIFTLCRDVYFPAGWTIAALAASGFFITFYPMPMGLASGYILGERASLSWFAGAAVGWLGLVPLLIHNGIESAIAQEMAQNAGMGLVLGSGIGFFVTYIVPRVRAIFQPIFDTSTTMRRLYPIYSAGGVVALYLLQVPLPAALLTVLFVWIMVAVAARMTGETNIDPLEQFGIFTGLVVSFAYSIFHAELSLQASFMIVAFVSVSCAIAGDAGHDYKSAALIGTRFIDIVKVDLITVAVAGLTGPFVLMLIRTGFADSLFTPETPAPQAQMVAGSIFGFTAPVFFWTGFVLAFVWEVAIRQVPEKYQKKVWLMPFGIGLFLGMRFALPLALGALIKMYIDRHHGDQHHTGIVIAAAIMGGEGISGFIVGALTSAGLSTVTGASVLIVLFVLLAILSGWLFFRSERGNIPSK